MVYLASVPTLAMLWAMVAYRRFPQLSSRDQLFQVGQLSTTLLGMLLVAALLIVTSTLIALVFSPKAARVPWIGLAINLAIWGMSVAAMVEPAPILGG